MSRSKVGLAFILSLLTVLAVGSIPAGAGQSQSQAQPSNSSPNSSQISAGRSAHGGAGAFMTAQMAHVKVKTSKIVQKTPLQGVSGTATPASVNPNATNTVDIFPGTVTSVTPNPMSSLGDMQGLVVVGQNAYVTNRNGGSPATGSIQKVTPSGQVSTVATGGSGNCSGVADTVAGIDSDGTDLYVVNGTGCDTLVRVTTAGVTHLVATRGIGPVWTEVTSGPQYLYASSCCSSPIDLIDPTTGAVTLNWLQTVTVGGQARTITSVHGITADANDLWITCILSTLSSQYGILRVNLADPSSGTFYYSTTSSIVGPSPLTSAGKYLYAPSAGRDGVVRITKRTGAVGLIAGAGSTATGDANGDWTYAAFNDIEGLSSDGTSALWVADHNNSKVKQIGFAPIPAQEFGPGTSTDAAAPTVTNGDPIDMATGNFSEAFNDFSLPGIGMPFTFTRTYNSMFANYDGQPSRFGYGWTDTLDASVELADNLYIVTLPSGQVVTFASVAPYTPSNGVFDTLTAVGGGFAVTQPDQTRYDFDSSGRLSDITDRNNHAITLHWDGPGLYARVDYVTDTAGRKIDISYDPTCGFVSQLKMDDPTDGRSVDYVYDAKCRLATVNELYKSGTGRKHTTYTYDSPNCSQAEICAIDHGMGTDVKLTYDSFGRVASQSVPISSTTFATTAYAYSSTQTSTQTTATRNNHIWTYDYSVGGLVPNATVLKDVIDPNGNKADYQSYSASKLLPLTISKPGGQVWQYTYNGAGLPLSIAPPTPLANSAVSYTYDQTFKSFPASMTQGVNGPVTQWIYDPTSGDLQCEILPVSTASVCNTTNGAFGEYNYTYSSNHLVNSVTDPDKKTTTFGYFGSPDGSKNGLLKSVTTQTGLITTYDYDSYLHRTTMVTPQGNVPGCGCAATYTWGFKYDDAGRLTSSWDPFGSSSSPTKTYGYDTDGNLISTVDVDGHATYRGYFPGGVLCYESRGTSGSCGAPPSSATTYAYDGDALLQSITHSSLTGDSGATRTTSLTYWSDGELHTLTNPIGQWTYSLRNYTSTASTATETPPTTDAITRTYDPMGRLTLLQYTTSSKPQIDTAPNVAYAYDKSGNLCNAVNGVNSTDCTPQAGGVSFTYDAANRMATSKTGTGSPFNYTYSNGGQGVDLVQRTYPDNTNVSYAYDGDHRLCAINMTGTSPTCSSGDFTYNYQLTAAPATITETSNAGKNKTTTTLDKAGRVTNLVNNYNTSTVSSSYNLTLDAAGYPTKVVVVNNGLGNNFKSETQTFQFDASGRLTQECYDGTLSGNCGTSTKILTGVKYSYDIAGNITRRQTFGVGSGNTYYGYNASDQVCWSGGTNGTNSICNTVPSGDTAISYNTLGDRKSIGTTTNAIRYDQANRMTQTTVGSTTTGFAYDALGNRCIDAVTSAQVTCSTTGTAYTWDPNSSTAELVKTVKTSTTNTYYFGDRLEASKSGSTTSYFQLDQTGSVANVISGTSIAASGSYDPYGVPRQGSPGVFGFDHEYKDSSTGFVDLRARMYDPATASFLQADPIGQHPDYTFGGGNPTMFSDPTGMSALDWFNEHFNPGYFFLRNCFLAPSSQSTVGKGVGCGAATVGLGLAAFDTEQIGALAVEKLAALGAAGEASGDVAVYTSMNAAGDVDYVGITNNIERRAAEHLASKEISITPINGLESLTRADARAVEQVLIEENGGPNGGQLLNKINSIATSNPTYSSSIQRGCALLAGVGYAAPNVCG